MPPSGVVAVQEYDSSPRRRPRSVSTKITRLQPRPERSRTCDFSHFLHLGTAVRSPVVFAETGAKPRRRRRRTSVRRTTTTPAAPPYRRKTRLLKAGRPSGGSGARVDVAL